MTPLARPSQSEQPDQSAQAARPTQPTRFARVPAIGAGADLHAEIDGWLSSEPLRELVRSFGGGPGVLDMFR